MTEHNVSEKGLRAIWRWVWNELPRTRESLAAAVLVATTIRDRGLPLDEEQRRLLGQFEQIMAEDAFDA